MMYNDELFEALSEAVLLGEAGTAGLLPEIKKKLFDYDIYRVSLLTDKEIDGIAGNVSDASGGQIAEKALKPRLQAVRDNAKVFVDIATAYHSVKGFIDRAIESEGRAAGMDKLRSSFSAGQFCLKEVGPEACESFLLIF